jgi:TP901 family phage tail tape measure protein
VADLKKTIEIVFGAVDDITPTVKSIQGTLGAIGEGAEDIAAPWAKVADNILKVDAALAAMAAGGVAYSIIKFAEFEDVMLKVKGILQANEEEYEALNAVTRELGATTRYTATEAAQGLEFLALAGFSTTEAIEAIPEVLNLAQAAAIDLGTAADIVTNIMAGYGIEVENLSKSNDVLTATFTNSNTDLQQLGDAFKYVGPVAKSLGLDLEETASILGVLGNAGYQAQMGGTALRNILVALVAPAGNMGKMMKELGVDTAEFGIDLSDSKNALRSLGVEVKDSEGNLKPFVDIMDQMKAGLDKIPDSADRTAVLIEIFGKRGGPQMAALLEQGSGAVLDLETKIRSLGGITGDIAEQMESGMGGALRAMKSAFDEVAISIGEKMSDALEESIDGVIAIERVFGEIIKSDTFDPVFSAINDFADELGKNLQTIAGNLPEAFKGVEFDDLIRSIGNVGDSLESLFDDVDLGTPERLREVIQFVVDSLTSLADVTAGMVDFFKPITQSMAGGIESFNEMDVAAKESSGELIGLAKSIVDLGANMTAAILLIGGAADKLAVPFEIAINTVSGAFDIVNVVWQTAKLTFLNILDDLLAASQVFSNTLLFGAFGDDIEANRQALAGMISDIENNLIGTTEKAIQKLTGIKVDVDSSDAVKEIETVVVAAGTVPDEKSLRLQAIADIEKADEEITAFWEDFLALPDEKDVAVNVDADTAEVDRAKEELTWFDENGTQHSIEIDVEKDQVTDVEKQIDDIPTEKMLEIKLQGDIDTQIAAIEAQAETAQAAFQYTAEVDIAQAQANADILMAAYDAASQSVEATADATASMFGDLASNMSELSQFDKWSLQGMVEDQIAMQEKALESQIKLNEAQAANIEAKTAAMERGDAMINITSDGLEPALEMILWQVIEKVQIRANEESADFLLGLNS